MTILPAIRTNGSSEETQEKNAQNVNQERTRRETATDTTKPVARRPFKRSVTPEANEHCLRKRFKDTSKHSGRRKQNRDRNKTASRCVVGPTGSGSVVVVERGAPSDACENIDPAGSKAVSGNAVVAVAPECGEPITCSSGSGENIIDTHHDAGEDATGFNSEDEYSSPMRNVKSLTEEEWSARDAIFSRCIAELGFEIKLMNEDGACLFRAIADQIFGDQELHYMVRTSCMDYIVKNKDFFASYVTEDFDKYIARKRKWNVHGNHLEIQAMSEMYNRTIEVYCYEVEPINIFNGPKISTDEPIRLSYHRMCHYNSISNPNNPSVGVGLGLPSYHTININRIKMGDAIRASEDLLIEQTMLEDKLKATDWEATNEALEEEVARESYIQYFRDAEKRLKPPQGHAAGSSCSTITSAMCSSPRPASRRGSQSPKGSASPKGNSSPRGAGSSAIVSVSSLRNSPRSSSSTSATEFSASVSNEDNFFPAATQSPKSSQAVFDYESIKGFQYGKEQTDGRTNDNSALSEDDWEDGIMAQVLAESRKTYLDDLKRNSKKLGSPGPSTSR